MDKRYIRTDLNIFVKKFSSFSLFVDRVAWTAPELQKTNAEPTLEGDKWSYGITVWEIMSYGEKPCGNMTSQEVRKKYLAGLTCCMNLWAC